MTDDNAAVPAPFDMGAINAAVDRMPPEQRAAALVEAESVAIGLDSMQLANEYAARGDLPAAARWYAVAARHGVDGAAEFLGEVEVLIDATAAVGIAGVAEGADAATVAMMLALQAMTPEQREQRLVELRKEMWRRLEAGESLPLTDSNLT